MQPLFRLSDNGSAQVVGRDTRRVTPSGTNTALDTWNLLEEKDYKRQQDEQDAVRKDEELQRQGIEKMLGDPVNAEIYAKQYRIPVTPELQQMLQNPKMARLTLDGMKIARQAGIDTYEGIKVFTGAYIESGGDPQKALDATKDYKSLAQRRYEEMLTRPSRGGGSNSRSSVVDGYKYGPLPTGTRLNQDSGEIEFMPGYDPSMSYRPRRGAASTGAMPPSAITDEIDLTQPQGAEPALAPLPAPTGRSVRGNLPQNIAPEDIMRRLQRELEYRRGPQKRPDAQEIPTD